MPLLRYRLNQKAITLDDCTGEVLVYRKGGAARYVRWLGFIDLHTAQRLPGAKPVRLKVEAYKVGNFGDSDSWISLGETQSVQGCYINGAVFGVVDGGIPRLVLRPKEGK